MSKYCTNCGRQIADDDHFCVGCGSKQEVVEPPVAENIDKSKYCIKCGNKLEEDDLFCGACGAKQETVDTRRRCIKCGREIADDELFCIICGTKQEKPIVEISTETKQAENPAVEIPAETPPEEKPAVEIPVEAEEEEPIVVEIPVETKPEEPIVVPEVKEEQSSAPVIEPEETIAPQKQEEKSAGKTKRSKKPLVIAICSIVVICIVAALAIFFLRGNSDETNTDKPAVIPNKPEETVDTPIDWNMVYADKIDEYKQALMMGAEAFEEKYDYGSDYSSINALMVSYAYRYGIDIGYTFFDVDGNGTPELIFSDLHNIIDIYTENNGSIIKLFEDCFFGDRSRVHVLAAGRLLVEGSSGASASSCELYQIDASTGKLTREGAYYCDGNGPSSYMTGYTYLEGAEYYGKVDTWLYGDLFEIFNWAIIAENPETNYDDPLNPEETDAPHTHNFGSWTDSNASSHTRTCSCGEKETEAHTFDSGKVTKEPTTTDTGTKTFTCTKCSATKTEVIAKLETHTHSFGSWTNANASSHTRVCSCGEKETEAHTFDSGKVTKEPTTTGTGIKTFTCTKCSATKTETIAKLQHTHSFGNWTSANASSHTRVCSCGEKETEAHSFDSGKVTKEPTTTDTGIKTFTCTKCSATKTETIAKLQHTHSFGNWTSANASTHTRSCSCGEKESEAHSFDSGKVTKEPTETSTGIKTFTCTECKATKTETIAKLQHTHSYGGWVDDYNGATHSMSCSCGATETQSHAFGSGTITMEPTYTSTGIMAYTCSVCGAQKEEMIPCIEKPEEDLPGYDKPDVLELDDQLICGICGHDNGTYHVVIIRGQVTAYSWSCSSCGTEHSVTHELT